MGASQVIPLRWCLYEAGGRSATPRFQPVPTPLREGQDRLGSHQQVSTVLDITNDNGPTGHRCEPLRPSAVSAGGGVEIEARQGTALNLKLRQHRRADQLDDADADAPLHAPDQASRMKRAPTMADKRPLRDRLVDFLTTQTDEREEMLGLLTREESGSLPTIGTRYQQPVSIKPDRQRNRFRIARCSSCATRRWRRSASGSSSDCRPTARRRWPHHRRNQTESLPRKQTAEGRVLRMKNRQGIIGASMREHDQSPAPTKPARVPSIRNIAIFKRSDLFRAVEPRALRSEEIVVRS